TVGWGETASAPTMTGDTLGGLVAAVRDHLAPLLVGQDAWTRTELAPKLRRALVGNTGAHSAVQGALLDLTGRASGQPLIDLVGLAPFARSGSSASRRRRRTSLRRERRRPRESTSSSSRSV